MGWSQRRTIWIPIWTWRGRWPKLSLILILSSRNPSRLDCWLPRYLSSLYWNKAIGDLQRHSRQRLISSAYITVITVWQLSEGEVLGRCATSTNTNTNGSIPGAKLLWFVCDDDHRDQGYPCTLFHDATHGLGSTTKVTGECVRAVPERIQSRPELRRSHP